MLTQILNTMLQILQRLSGVEAFRQQLNQRLDATDEKIQQIYDGLFGTPAEPEASEELIATASRAEAIALKAQSMADQLASISLTTGD